MCMCYLCQYVVADGHRSWEGLVYRVNFKKVLFMVTHVIFTSYLLLFFQQFKSIPMV